MATLLFFDDWCLESHQNIERKMGKPQWVKEGDFFDPGMSFDQDLFRSFYYPSVFYDENLGRWRAFYSIWAKALNGMATLATAESDDGIHWYIPDLNERFPDKNRMVKNEVFTA